eukprot:CAMPEP_0185252458 /NCGR_PEP_ID=MMETSP1359-20130426/1536_1 /TAXON_ID=552665 /ORGANISM="Bigelowiella longifila, Strain CCMP242" /LENGTH=216 /DNA_ID=CAMNT_0027834621 /DNA_START=56 /DNA_END=706 /DNA_ORIENTATION=+
MDGAEDPFEGVVEEGAQDDGGAQEAGDMNPFGGAVGDEEGGEADNGAELNEDAVFGGMDGGDGDAADLLGMDASDDALGGLDSKDDGEGGIGMMSPPTDGPYTKWQEEHSKVLEKRRAEAREKKEKILEEAEQKLKKFYDDKNSDKTKMHSENLDEEKQKRADIAKLFETGNDWEKVCKMLSLAPDSNRKVDRFRKLLQTLKNEGTYGKSKREAKE